MEFTDVAFYFGDNNLQSKYENIDSCWITFESLNLVTTSSSLDFNFEFSKKNFTHALEILKQECDESSKILLFFSSNISYQDYIKIKSQVISFETIISNNEFFY